MPDQPGSTVLENIVSAQRLTLEDTRSAVPLERVQQLAEARQERRNFVAALLGTRTLAPRRDCGLSQSSNGLRLRGGCCGSIIAAAKSPCGYADGGASALSVLTEERYFRALSKT